MAHGAEYVLGRDISGSIRLDAQHLLWKLHKGYELHPAIPITKDMKIADLGTGTAIWILDLARQVPSSVQLHGFDISGDQFPLKELWPQNVTLGLLNSFSEPPEAFSGQYDVVHLRMWASNLRESDTSSLVNHVKNLLSMFFSPFFFFFSWFVWLHYNADNLGNLLTGPGGYLQWEDADLVHQRVQGVTGLAFEQRMNHIFKRAGIDYSWVSDLPNRLHQDGFTVHDADSCCFEPHLMQLCTNTYLMAIQEILHGIKRAYSESLTLFITEQERLLSDMTRQKAEGIIYNWSPVSVLAQIRPGHVTVGDTGDGD
ncbi:hypothetical protein N7452_003239 [Penicillium brevicompactum]|uniref:Methyltransferase domain-containing protein n=1 Tax=Penicillium brevicompactum TaxID=5074 RepID=A0A9W9UM98_PENBR|nr:hypothetical protein N7452_003239 [Penicillium brevicompactum]